jgi:hypothetical protein
VKYVISSIGLASALLLGPAASTQRPGAGGPPSYSPQQYTSDVQQLGYEHGYRDGADRGRQDRDRGLGRASAQNAYLDSARYSYNPSYGNRQEYMSGYRDGFQAGYDDGYAYYERPGRYGEIYQRPAPAASRNNRSRFDSGYREGVAAGQQDLQRNARSDYRRSSPYRSGDPQFQDGFERGYQDGYGRSRYQYDGGGYFPNSGNNAVLDTRDGVGPRSKTITVSSTQQWTPTGIRVNQGDRLTFQSSGEIQISAGANNRASVAGSLSGRFVQSAPIPNALAGALIGRIDSGQPFGIGNQTSIVAPASGMLYLGINDDTLNDNSGQFTVVLSW